MKQIGLLITLSLLMFTQYAWSGGLWLYEVAHSEVGTASAGSAAIAERASTAGTNPAGMTRLKRSELMAGFQPMYLDSKFDIDSATYGTDDGGQNGGFIPSASLFYVHDYSPDVKFGLALGSYKGLGLDYGDSWAGRYFVTEAELLTFAINPSVAFKVNNQLSIGIGFDVLYSTLEQTMAFNNNPFGIGNNPDGKIELEDSDLGYGYNIGLLYEFSDSTRLGFHYRSEIDVEFEDALTLKGVLPILPGLNLSSDAGIEMTFPQSLMISGYHELDSQWALVGNLGWQNWSEFGKSEFTLNNINKNIKTDRNFDDTYHVALGVHYQYSDDWKLLAGIAYDTSPVSKSDSTLDLPLDRQVRYGLGAEYLMNEDVTIMVGYELVDLGDASINQTRGILDNDTIQGDFETNYLHILTINASWKF
ncbi:MAG: outer membrane protein transport protein [gamma proteobacterium symbiont of Bathyaustriella thionipta]|nr:outer membrane protein transport protein [gamma proteobacterium symbiont of Bathyaustriella thionipta]MCU7950638.1 outer membrane protein transport protein [gamma proteobacterium symbiont of Bathyaustriella thionipta]MCU7952530.1 outer membrane protein transport protein [gamma proteobacterium symbiont of Bathyaustriella thionipta]MCU7957163.1 outer membrane protein transport protein [gamma proteobacterium symbiont of Bathyaustriella thionipta]MCU7967102.1 outer membrane protein transport pro